MWGAQDRNQEVAIKVINTAALSAGDLQALDEEVRILKLINHPNIITLEDFVPKDKTYYIIMEKCCCVNKF